MPKAAPKPAEITLEIIQDPHESAERAGLLYVSDDEPGIRRKKAGKSWSYIGLDGKPIKDKTEIERINKLAIPPAYRNVWICPDVDGHIQATGLDERGRKQYRYHARWRQARDENKFARMMAFAGALPQIREHATRDAAKAGFGREKVLGALILLLEKTAIRVGNEEYARQNNSYGLTTMENQHVEVEGAQAHFHFRGKSGKWHDIDLKDRRLANIIRRLQDLPGQSLFQFQDDEGTMHNLSSSDVNAYLKEISGEEFTAKDFRTWAGTVAACVALQELEFVDETQAKRHVVEAVKLVSKKLGNTPAVCRKSYIHPAVLDSFLDGTLISALQAEVEEELSPNGASLKAEEAAVLRLLQTRLSEKVAA